MNFFGAINFVVALMVCGISKDAAADGWLNRVSGYFTASRSYDAILPSDVKETELMMQEFETIHKQDTRANELALAQEIVRKNNEIAKKKLALQGQKNKVARYRQRLAVAQEEMAHSDGEAASKSLNLILAQEENQKAKIELTRVSDKLSLAEREIESAKTELQATARELALVRTQMSEMQKKLEDATTANNDVKSQTSELKKSLDDVEEFIAEKTNELGARSRRLSSGLTSRDKQSPAEKLAQLFDAVTVRKALSFGETELHVDVPGVPASTTDATEKARVILYDDVERLNTFAAAHQQSIKQSGKSFESVLQIPVTSGCLGDDEQNNSVLNDLHDSKISVDISNLSRPLGKLMAFFLKSNPQNVTIIGEPSASSSEGSDSDLDYGDYPSSASEDELSDGDYAATPGSTPTKGYEEDELSDGDYAATPTTTPLSSPKKSKLMR